MNFGGATGLSLGTLTISKATPKAEHLNYSLTGATYDGATHGIALPTLKSGYSGMGAITVKYDGSPTAPTNAGEYAITVDVAAGANFGSATSLSLGKLTISKATPAATHLSYTLPTTVTYDGAQKSVAVALKSSYSGASAITVKYDGSPTAPANAGEYDITVDVAGGTNFGSATGISLGTLTIGKATPAAKHLSYSLPAIFAHDGLPHSVPVTMSSGYDGMGAITVKYGGSLSAPTDTGTYAVTVDVVEDKNFFAATGLWLGTLTIGKATPTLEHLQYALPYTVVYDGSPHSVSVTPKPGCSGMGDIAVKYNGSPTAPTNAGEYAITVDVAGGASFLSAAELSLGTLTIGKATPAAKHMSYTLPDVFAYDG
jgi:hypothetical protein